MSDIALDQLPGYRRRFIVTPAEGCVQTALEDDYHCMTVTVHHAGGIATSITSEQSRAPWNTCPGSLAQLEKTFTGVALDGFAARGEKSSNCTHLHDLALLAAAHAADTAPLIYDILVSDPIDGQVRTELRRNGEAVLGWRVVGNKIAEPAELTGLGLMELGPWIASLDRRRQEEARLLRWGTMVAHGRSIPLEKQSDASQMRGNCYTFQPHIVTEARRIGIIRDFNDGTAQPLDGYTPTKTSNRP